MQSNRGLRRKKKLNASQLASPEVIDKRLREVYLALVVAVGNASAIELKNADTSKEAWALFMQCYRRKFADTYRLRTIAQLKHWAGIREGSKFYSEQSVQHDAMNSMNQYFAWINAFIKIACSAKLSTEYLRTSLCLANISTK